jgi:predicted Zn finger-like uncharacterized protein
VKISCPSCQAKYSIADEKVNDRLAKIRCRKCGANIVIDGKVNPPNVYTAAGDAPDAGSADHEGSGAQYSVDFGEGDQRNLSVAEIVSAYNSGQVTADTFLWADGFADWKPLGEVDEIVEALNSAAAPARAAGPSPWAAPAAAPRAAARARGGAADLFGRIETAGSEEEVTTSAPEGALGSGGGSSTGARNESSVLFSLSALTSASSPSVSRASSSSRPVSSAANRDDSGLIDLKALTAAATRSEAAAAPIAAPIMASPLGMAPPLGLASPLGNPMLSSAEPMGGNKSKTPLILGICAVVAALVVALAIVLKPPPPPPPPAIVVTQQAPPPAPVPTPEPVVTAPPATSAADSASDKKGAVAHKAVGGGGGAVKKAAGGGTPSGGGDAPPPPPKKKGGGCGCAAGDLMCNMACSAK